MSMSSRNALLITATLCVTAVASPAQARWETAHGSAIQIGGKCPNTHTYDPQLRATDGRPFDVPAGFSNEIEIYGHGIDLSGGVTVSGLPGLAASIARGVSGAENGLRGCGAIGSIVLRIEVAPNTAGTTGSLRIGTETFPLRIINASIIGAAWSDATMRRERGTSGGSGGTGGPVPVRPISAGGNTTGCGPLGCPQSQSGGVTLGSSGTTASGRAPDYPSGIGECIDDIGGSAVPNDAFEDVANTLTVTLPTARGAAELTCLTRPAIFEVRGNPTKGDVGGFRAGAGYQPPAFGKSVLPPRYSGTTTGLTGPRTLPAPDQHVQTVAMTRDLAATFVGERSIRLSSTVSGAGPLTLILKSIPSNGIRTIEGVPFNGARVSSRIDVRFDFLAALRTGGEAISWRLQPISLGAPDNCFTATTGTATVTTPIGTIALTATENAGCVGARFALSIAPQKQGMPVFAAPYAQTVLFTLPARTAPAPLAPPQLGSPNRP